jgi:ferredoxin
MIRVRVDRAKCTSAGQCVFAAPDVFAFDAEGIAVTLRDTFDDADADRLFEVADLCPSIAIVVEESAS